MTPQSLIAKPQSTHHLVLPLESKTCAFLKVHKVYQSRNQGEANPEANQANSNFYSAPLIVWYGIAEVVSDFGNDHHMYAVNRSELHAQITCRNVAFKNSAKYKLRRNEIITRSQRQHHRGAHPGDIDHDVCTHTLNYLTYVHGLQSMTKS